MWPSRPGWVTVAVGDPETAGAAIPHRRNAPDWLSHSRPREVWQTVRRRISVPRRIAYSNCMVRDVFMEGFPVATRCRSWLTCLAVLVITRIASGADAPKSDGKPAAKAAAQSDQAADQEPKQIPTKGSMLVRVIGPDGQPIEGAKLFANVSWFDLKAAKARSVIENNHYLTGRDGTVAIKLPKLVEDVRLWARKEGHVPMFASWWPMVSPEFSAMPEEFTYSLQDGTTLGGIVTNDEGEPIEGVQVEASYHGTDFRKSGGRAVFDNLLAFGDGAVRTDFEGRWQLNNVPPGDDIDIQIRLCHPKYIGDDEWGRLQKEQQVTLASLRDETAVIVMPLRLEERQEVANPLC